MSWAKQQWIKMRLISHGWHWGVGVVSRDLWGWAAGLGNPGTRKVSFQTKVEVRSLSCRTFSRISLVILTLSAHGPQAWHADHTSYYRISLNKVSGVAATRDCDNIPVMELIDVTFWVYQLTTVMHDS